MKFGFALTACIIVRTVVKPAKSGWWTSVASEDGRTEVVLGDDPRFFGVVEGVVYHVGQRAGLSASDQQQLAEAAAQACLSTFPLLNGHESRLKLIVKEFADRIEITLEHSGEAVPIAGLDSFASGIHKHDSDQCSGASLLTRVDRVLYETCDACSRITLVKYLAERAPET